MKRNRSTLSFTFFLSQCEENQPFLFGSHLRSYLGLPIFHTPFFPEDITHVMASSPCAPETLQRYPKACVHAWRGTLGAVCSSANGRFCSCKGISMTGYKSPHQEIWQPRATDYPPPYTSIENPSSFFIT